MVLAQIFNGDNCILDSLMQYLTELWNNEMCVRGF